ncbi:hypothetical protein CES85_0501 [Ochrobactrum quorumnocens]|uniref:Uncharacterized protein n=1 Tax=Ochrobactrum quorumnocens TaxID=271865 RepID=A0A248UGE0_9HYPH|nr:hypothetical protein CES85_0501 [[Ochrobactrum] quorumnocens]
MQNRFALLLEMLYSALAASLGLFLKRTFPPSPDQRVSLRAFARAFPNLIG